MDVHIHRCTTDSAEELEELLRFKMMMIMMDGKNFVETFGQANVYRFEFEQMY